MGQDRSSIDLGINNSVLIIGSLGLLCLHGNAGSQRPPYWHRCICNPCLHRPGVVCLPHAHMSEHVSSHTIPGLKQFTKQPEVSKERGCWAFGASMQPPASRSLEQNHSIPSVSTIHSQPASLKALRCPQIRNRAKMPEVHSAMQSAINHGCTSPHPFVWKVRSKKPVSKPGLRT